MSPPKREGEVIYIFNEKKILTNAENAQLCPEYPPYKVINEVMNFQYITLDYAVIYPGIPSRPEVPAESFFGESTCFSFFI